MTPLYIEHHSGFTPSTMPVILASFCLFWLQEIINIACWLENNQLETSGLMSHSPRPLSFSSNHSVKRSMSLSNRPSNHHELEWHDAVVDSGRRVRGHGERLINKVLYDFIISVRGHRRRMSHHKHTHKTHVQYNQMERWQPPVRRSSYCNV